MDGKEFKPAIIRTPAVNSWNNAPVLASDRARDYALDKLAAIPDTNYAGAPYIRQLPSGEVILSYQGNELRNDFKWDHSDMIVSIGSSEGKNFNRKSIPFISLILPRLLYGIRCALKMIALSLRLPPPTHMEKLRYG